MLGQRSGRIILGNPEAGNATVIRLLQQPKGGAGYCDSLDILLQWNSAPFTAGDAIPLSIQIKGESLVIRAFLSRFEIPRPRPSSMDCVEEAEDPREKPHQTGIRPRTGVEIVGEFTENEQQVHRFGRRPCHIGPHYGRLRRQTENRA